MHREMYRQRSRRKLTLTGPSPHAEIAQYQLSFSVIDYFEQDIPVPESRGESRTYKQY